MEKKIRAVGTALLVLIWLALTGFAWFGQRTEVSEAERRPLASAPTLSVEAINEGDFMEDFEDFTLDQFPLRDSFRQIKSLFHFYGLQQLDNNDIYIKDGYAAKQLYPLNEDSVNYAVKRFNDIYTQFLEGKAANCYVTVVPDKGYYLSEKAGQLTADYEKLFSLVEGGMPWATYIDLTATLEASDYYRTDTHWKQENLIPVAQKLTQAMGVTPPAADAFTPKPVDYPFYGVYYGQAAVPQKPDQLQIMESDILKDCKVYTYDDNLKKTQIPMYDLSKLTSGDPYNIYLSGARVGLVQIENPNATTDRDLIVFRDSFGSSIGPLLAQGYKTVTLIDIREIPSPNLKVLAMYLKLDFSGDVLMLYSTTVLNAGNELK